MSNSRLRSKENSSPSHSDSSEVINNELTNIESSSNQRMKSQSTMSMTKQFRQQLQKQRSPSPHSSTGRHFEHSGFRLAQEIHDEFLVCKICLEAYKSPKCLNCLHTFCEQCIESHVMSESTYKKYSDYREFTCPLCRKRTQLPLGGVKKLPDNFLVSSLTELVDRQKPSEFPFCDICKMVNKKHKEAISKCLDCSKLLCKSCVDMHKETKVTKNHSIFDMEIEKDVECKEHEGEVVRFYCEPCEMCVCILCTFNEHRDHDVSQFADAVSLYKVNIEALLNECKEKSDIFDVHMASLSGCENVIKQAEQTIHDTTLSFISELRCKEKQLIDDLRNLYGHDTIEYIENKQDIAVAVDGLRSTCSLTEVILKGKDIELLLLKKEVQDKLNMLKTFQVRPLPTTINKKIEFIVGKVDLGYLFDTDRPISSKIGNGISNAFTQTDTDLEKVKLSDTNKKSDTEDDSDTDDDDDDDDDDEDDADVSHSGVETIDRGVQTIIFSELNDKNKKDDGESGDDDDDEEEEDDDDDEEDTPVGDSKAKADSVILTKDVSTETIPVLTEERAVNTRSRSLQPTTGDDSLANRRRRQRRRPDIGQSFDSIAGPESPYEGDGRRNRFSYNSFDTDDMFYDANDTKSQIINNNHY